MAKAASNVGPRRQPGTFGATGLAGVTIGTRPLRGLVQIAGWGDFETRAEPVLRSVGLKDPGDYRTAQKTGTVTAWRIAPDRLLFEGAEDLSSHHSGKLVVLDLSHARTVITLEGDGARDLLSSLIALNTQTTVFAKGHFLQTVIQGVGVLVQCTGDTSFEIFVPRTWAGSLWDLVYDTGLSFGVTVQAG